MCPEVIDDADFGRLMPFSWLLSAFQKLLMYPFVLDMPRAYVDVVGCGSVFTINNFCEMYQSIGSCVRLSPLTLRCTV